MKNALIVAAVVAICVTGFFVFRGSSKSSGAETRESASEEVRGDSPRKRVAPKRMRSDSKQPPSAKRYSGDGQAKPAPQREYVRNDGTVVRDHRANSPEPNLERHMTVPKEISKIQPETLRAVRIALRPAMKSCISEHAGAAEEGSKAQATLTVSVTDGELKVDKLHVGTEGLSPEADEAMRACATEAMLGHSQAVEGVEDVKRHVMTFPYDL